MTVEPGWYEVTEFGLSPLTPYEVGPGGILRQLDPTLSNPHETSGLPLVQPEWSEHFRSRCLVNCHYKFSGSSSNVHYHTDQLTALLAELKVWGIRDRLLIGTGSNVTKQAAGFAALAAAGMRVHVTLSVDTDPGWWNTTQADIEAYWAKIALHPDWYLSVGGPNEPDDLNDAGTGYTAGADWLTKLVNHMQMMHNRRAAAGMQAIPIVAPSLKDGQTPIMGSYAAVAATPMHTYLDYGDMHRYPLGANAGDPTWQTTQPDAGSRTPSFLVDYRLDGDTTHSGARDAYHDLPMYWTEGGYNTDLAVTVGGEHLPDDIHGHYALRTFFEAAIRGIRRFFYYELMDDPDRGKNNSEAHRGLVFVDVDNPGSTPAQQAHPDYWVRKPAFHLLKQVMTDCYDPDPGGVYHPDTNPWTPPKVRLRVTCDDPTFRSYLVAKRNGEARLYYWLDKALWDVAADARLDGGLSHTLLGHLPTGSLPGGQDIDELSGIVASRKHANVFWVHDDSNPGRLVFGLDMTGGISHRKTLRLVGDDFATGDFDTGQWEDAAYDVTTGSIWVANCGGNNAQFTAYKFTEPDTLGAAGDVLEVTATRYRFGYASGTYNCEAMLCGPDGRVYFVPKHNNVGSGQNAVDTGLWQAPATLVPWPAVNTLTKVKTIGKSGHVVTSADWHPDGSWFCTIRSSNQVPETTPAVPSYKYDGATFADAGQFDIAVARKVDRSLPVTNEGVAFTADGSGVLTTCEGVGTEVWLTSFGGGATAGVTVETPAGTVVVPADGTVRSVVLPA